MKLLPRHGLTRRLAALGLFLLSVTVHAQSFQPIAEPLQRRELIEVRINGSREQVLAN